MTVKLRFAPSPTGLIHLGNSRTALLNWLYALKNGGQFVLRFDDTDLERSRREYADAIEADLAWFGVKPDVMVRQSDRIALYDAAAAKLKAAGLLYPCYETADELERRRSRARAMGRPPVYDRAALKLTAEDKAKLEAEGRQPHWRFLLPNHDGDPLAPRRTDVAWDDLCRGSQSIDLASLSDPVLARADGSYLYTFTSVVDDADMGITHVIRGEDHVANTAVQIAIFEALGAPLPRFAHHNLLTTLDGEGLSKRKGALSISSLREAGIEPMAVASLAVLTGTSHAVEPVRDMDTLAGMLDLSGISRSSAKFDPQELDSLNARLVHAMTFEEAGPRLAALGIGGGEAFWLAVRENCARFGDAAGWWAIISGDLPADAAQVADEDRTYLAEALALLPEGPLDGSSWGIWTGLLKEKTGRKGKTLFMPLRLALTGHDHGPDMKALLPLIGRERTAARLS